MKKLLLSFIVLMFTVNLSFTQVTLTTAVDFTVTDIDGNTHNLFTYLAYGKYVVIDFFFTT